MDLEDELEEVAQLLEGLDREMSPPRVVLGDELDGVAELFDGERSPPRVVLGDDLDGVAKLFDGEISPPRVVLGDQANEEHDHEVQIFLSWGGCGIPRRQELNKVEAQNDFQ